MDEILGKVKKIISDKFGVSPDSISPDSDLAADLNLSTIEINDLLSFARKEFTLTIPQDAEVEQVSTIQDLLNFIDNYSEIL